MDFKHWNAIRTRLTNLFTSLQITQLTGFSDPVYAEAYVNVNQYDIVLDVLVVNQTSDTLQNCTIELATLGDLKLVERPQPMVLGPMDFCSIKANVKVTSTENGIIFGNIVYDCGSTSSDRNVVVLNDIHIDIMDYIVPASCTEAEFRQMWAEFEWENKVAVNTPLNDLHEYLAALLKVWYIVHRRLQIHHIRLLLMQYVMPSRAPTCAVSRPRRPCPASADSWPPTSTPSPSSARTPWPTCRWKRTWRSRIHL